MDNNNNFNGSVQNPYGNQVPNQNQPQNQNQNMNQGYSQQPNQGANTIGGGYQTPQYQYQQQQQFNQQTNYNQQPNYNQQQQFGNQAYQTEQSALQSMLSADKIENTDKVALLATAASNVLVELIYLIYCIFQTGVHAYSSYAIRSWGSTVVATIIWIVIYIAIYAAAMYVKKSYKNNAIPHAVIGVLVVIIGLKDLGRAISYLTYGKILFALADIITGVIGCFAAVTSLMIAYNIYNRQPRNNRMMNGQQQYNPYNQQPQQFNQYGQQPQNMNQQYSSYNQTQQNQNYGVNGLGANQPYMTGQQPQQPQNMSQQPQNMNQQYNQYNQPQQNPVQNNSDQKVNLDKSNDSQNNQNIQ
jgi:hypothetical protein